MRDQPSSTLCCSGAQCTRAIASSSPRGWSPTQSTWSILCRRPWLQLRHGHVARRRRGDQPRSTPRRTDDETEIRDYRSGTLRRRGEASLQDGVAQSADPDGRPTLPRRRRLLHDRPGRVRRGRAAPQGTLRDLARGDRHRRRARTDVARRRRRRRRRAAAIAASWTSPAATASSPCACSSSIRACPPRSSWTGASPTVTSDSSRRSRTRSRRRGYTPGCGTSRRPSRTRRRRRARRWCRSTRAGI